jgi:crossover junction endodeoxyribonuclease RuvC
MSRYRRRSWRAFGEAAAPVAPAAPAVPAASPVRILGLDPGSRRTGFGVLECRGGKLVMLAQGCLDVSRAGPALRLRLIFEGLQSLIASHCPGEVAVERVFMSRNADSALKLGQARGAALCAVPRGVPVFEYAPRAVKLALVGSGAAEKFQVAHMVRALLGIGEALSADAADALAVAVCRAHERDARELLHRAGGASCGQALR